MASFLLLLSPQMSILTPLSRCPGSNTQRAHARQPSHPVCPPELSTPCRRPSVSKEQGRGPRALAARRSTRSSAPEVPHRGGASCTDISRSSSPTPHPEQSPIPISRRLGLPCRTSERDQEVRGLACSEQQTTPGPLPRHPAHRAESNKIILLNAKRKLTALKTNVI